MTRRHVWKGVSLAVGFVAVACGGSKPEASAPESGEAAPASDSAETSDAPAETAETAET